MYYCLDSSSSRQLVVDLSKREDTGYTHGSRAGLTRDIWIGVGREADIVYTLSQRGDRQ